MLLAGFDFPAGYPLLLEGASADAHRLRHRHSRHVESDHKAEGVYTKINTARSEISQLKRKIKLIERNSKKK